jgi:hypothetical protein
MNDENMEKMKIFIYSVFDGIWHYFVFFVCHSNFHCLTDVRSSCLLS